MALKTRRYSRYSALRLGNAFLPFEARPLSKIPPGICPYFKQLIEGRRNDVKTAARKGYSKEQWENEIKGYYKKNDWLSLNRKGEKVADPWKMLRSYEDEYRAKQPEYESPWEPRGRKWQDFYTKLERTMQMQRGLA